jgi:hypothetical protein
MTGPWPSFWKVGFRDDNGRVQAMDPMDGMDLMDARDDGRAVVGIDLAVGPSQKIYLSDQLTGKELRCYYTVQTV